MNICARLLESPFVTSAQKIRTSGLHKCSHFWSDERAKTQSAGMRNIDGLSARMQMSFLAVKFAEGFSNFTKKQRLMVNASYSDQTRNKNCRQQQTAPLIPSNNSIMMSARMQRCLAARANNITGKSIVRVRLFICREVLQSDQQTHKRESRLNFIPQLAQPAISSNWFNRKRNWHFGGRGN
jgi:hypothetical protein